ncbi:uncharacterized protein LOC144463926 [Epinephelus lanceolatus]
MQFISMFQIKQKEIICRCNMPCRDKGHFHCPFCDKTVIRKDFISPHSSPSSSEGFAQSLDHSYALPPAVSAPATTTEPPEEAVTQELPSSHLSHPLSQTASPKTLTLVTDHLPPATTTDPPEPPLPSSHAKCPHCTIVLYKKNLALHIQRQDNQQKDITTKSHLKSTCVDQNNGIYAVRKIAKGFSVPVHVLRKTWGQHVTKCEMEDCPQYHLPAQRSGLSHSLCHHIWSVDYCSQ